MEMSLYEEDSEDDLEECFKNYLTQLNKLPKELLIKILLFRDTDFSKMDKEECEILQRRLDNRVRQITIDTKYKIINDIKSYMHRLSIELNVCMDWSKIKYFTITIYQNIDRMSYCFDYDYINIFLSIRSEGITTIPSSPSFYEHHSEYTDEQKAKIKEELSTILEFLSTNQLVHYIVNSWDRD